MKRILALVLAVTLLLSLFVAPVAAEGDEISFDPAPTVSLTAVSYTPVANSNYVSGGNTITSVKPGDKLAVKLSVTNNAETTMNWAGGQFFIKYDQTAFETDTFIYEDQFTGVNTEAGPIVAELPRNNGGFAYGSGWVATENFDIPGVIQFTKASPQAQREIKKDESLTIAYILFKVKDTAENGVRNFEFDVDQEQPNKLIAAEELNTASSTVAGIDFSKIHTDNVSVVEGALPTIASVSIDSTGAVYGANGEYALTATSTKGGDITNSVNWSVEPAAKGVSIDSTTLKVTETAPVGEYTVTASAKENESSGEASATFTITPKTITDPTVSVTGFVKRHSVNNVLFMADNGLKLEWSWYEGEGDVSTKTPLDNSYEFKAETAYTLVLTLTPRNDNYTLAEGTSVTVTGVGERQTVTLGADGTVTVTGTTAGKDELAVLLVPEIANTAYYGMTLGKLSFKPNTGTVIVKGDESRTPVAGHFEWVDDTKDVGEPTVGISGSKGSPFAAKFVPDDKDNYAELTFNIYVHVNKAQIHISDIKGWNYTEAFKYDRTEHTVELDIPEALKSQIKVDYKKNTAMNVGTYTATATISPEDEAHYAIFEENHVLTLDWEIKKGTLTDYEPTYTKEVTFGAAQQFDITPDLFGLPAYDVEHFNVQDPSSTIEDDPLLTNRTILSNGGINYELRATTIEDVNNNVTSERTLTYLYDNYEAFTVKLIIKVIAKTTNSDTLKITVPNEVTYGTTVNPSVGDTKPADAGEVTFKFFDKDGKQVTDQPFPVGEYKVTAICEDSSTIYTAEKSFKVVPYELKDENVTLGSDLAYTGIEQTQTVTVTVDGKTLTVGTDYTVTGLTATEPGTYTVTVTGTGNYNGTGTKTFEIKKADIATADISDIEGPFGYTGIAWEPTVTVKFNNAVLTLGTDYTVSYLDNVNVGTATVTITGTGDHFKGTATKTFEITAASINGFTVSTVAVVTYNTKAQTPAVTVANSGRILTADDYDVKYTDNVNAGTATVTVTGKGNFTGTASKNFAIAQAYLSVENQTVTHFRTETDAKSYAVPADMFLADEKETGFTITVTDYAGDAIFTTAPAVDGTNVNYKLNGTVGTAFVEVKVKPDSSNYANASFTLTFVVNDKENVSGSISFPDGSAVYTGTGIKYENATISGYSGTLRYGYTPNASTGASLDASGLPLTVGTYTVTATYSDASSYGYKTATFTITKATPTGTPGYTKLETSGKTLADAKLTVGTIRPAGTIAWDLPLTTVREDGKAYAWTFTPADTHNYTILTGTLVPYVDDGMDYIPGVIGGNTGSFNFHDVSRLDYFYDAVKWAAENGIASGTGRYTFSPNAVCTRAQTVTFLWRAAGSPLPRYRVCPFTDVQPNDYYYNAVLWAVEQGITTGLNATTFGPDVTVTRGQVATFLYRAASAAKPNTFNPFTDVKTTAYNYDAILWAYDNRITTGTSDTTFSPDAYCTRAQIVTFLYRYYQGR